MENDGALRCLEERMEYSFADKKLLGQALTHSSFANEHRLQKFENNERLEYLGDAVLEMVSSEMLYHRYAVSPEGVLTKRRAALVCEEALAMSARKLRLGSELLLGKGEDAGGGRERNSILSDALEAVIGAIFIDGGIEAAKRFILDHVLVDVEEKLAHQESKSVLQEMIQREGHESISYELVAQEGPDHDKTFTVRVLVGGEPMGTGKGHTKKEAEQMAAAQAVKTLKKQ